MMPGFATMPDILAPNLRVLFCGINPSLYSVEVGHHFARPGNRFWRALHEGGFTPRRFLPSDENELLACGLGITNVAPRATVAAADLSRDELKTGGIALREKVKCFTPQTLAILGIGAYRVAFAKPKAQIGAQEEIIGKTRVWVLPNPSGLNAHYPPAQLAHCFADLREHIGHVSDVTLISG
jgi:TDG/mug DNA glycosylase family protein